MLQHADAAASMNRFVRRPGGPTLTALHLLICGSIHTLSAPPQLDLLLAPPAPLAHVTDLTVAFDPTLTMQLLLSPRFCDRWFIQRLLAACGALRRLHLHFHLRLGLEHTLEHLWQECVRHSICCASVDQHLLSCRNSWTWIDHDVSLTMCV